MSVSGLRQFGFSAMCATVIGLCCACSDNSRIEASWHKHDLVDNLLVRWLKVSPTDTGFMRTAIDRHWKPLVDQPGYLTEQARLVYAMTVGYEATKDQRYLAAAKKGADLLLTHYRDSIHGGFFLRVGMDGKVISSAKNTYAHAFALLALSSVAGVTGDAKYRKAALQAWQDIDTGLRDANGGFCGERPREFTALNVCAGDAKSQNPLMHLFEALLALDDATHDPMALKGAKDVADFVIYKLLTGAKSGGAYIPEWYDRDWKPLLTREKGGYVDIGHQFEWSHMLLAAEKHGLGGIYAPTAQRLLQFAVETGYDEAAGGVFTKMFPDGTIDRNKFWWQQTEGMRAFLAAASATGRQDMWRRYEQTMGVVKEQFVDKNNGGWYPRSTMQCGGCPDDQPEPYHMIAMHMMALTMAADRK